MSSTTHEITRNLGGNRLGSGNKNDITLHKYNRSSHDLSRAWRSTMNVGTLVPFLVQPVGPGDTFSIDLEAMVRTVPTLGPIYGSYKLQLDVFNCPVRLYNGLLHNNMMKIGMDMQNVKLPKITLKANVLNPDIYEYEMNQSQISSDSLINYLGMSGVGDATFSSATEKNHIIERKIQAVPLMAYWDIYKNYYINKQEEYGLFIAPKMSQGDTNVRNIVTYTRGQNHQLITGLNILFKRSEDSVYPATAPTPTEPGYQALTTPLTLNYYKYEITTPEIFDTTNTEILMESGGTYYLQDINNVFTYVDFLNDNNKIIMTNVQASYYGYNMIGICYKKTAYDTTEIELKGVTTAELDQQRIDILKDTGIGNELMVNNLGYEPYKTICGTDTNGNTVFKYHQTGLAIKTYQSDLFNNWLKSEWIEGSPGVPGIQQITAVDTSSGNFTIDALNLAQKVYNMLNRIAVSGGSYEDYIEAVYSTTAARRAETPVYMGGMAQEIVFEEVVSTAQSGEDPLGSLAGKGTITGKRGGHIEIKNENEHSFVIGIVSITPRIDYSQGNKWFLTELDSLDDWHKPALDGIGFEDLLQENMAWWGTYYDTTNLKWVKKAAGKVPAWIKYMTAVNECHGEFAEENKTMFMTLNRRYEYRERTTQRLYPLTDKEMGIADQTTYVNPTKFNYAFAYSELAAQNFWVQIGIKMEAREVMSAKIIPNL